MRGGVEGGGGGMIIRLLGCHGLSSRMPVVLCLGDGVADLKEENFGRAVGDDFLLTCFILNSVRIFVVRK